MLSLAYSYGILTQYKKCLGKNLVIKSDNNMKDALMAEMLAVLNEHEYLMRIFCML